MESKLVRYQKKRYVWLALMSVLGIIGVTNRVGSLFLEGDIYGLAWKTPEVSDFALLGVTSIIAAMIYYIRPERRDYE